MPASAHELFDPARHEPLSPDAWSEAKARQSIARIAAAAEAEFDDTTGNWPMHPQDEPAQPGQRSVNAYWGATGVAWALHHLAAEGAIAPGRDLARWMATYPERVRAEAADEMHGTASWLFGEAAALRLAWRVAARPQDAQRLQAVVQGNLHNPAHEPLWGNGGTLLAAIGMAEDTGQAHWPALVQQGVQALCDDMVTDPETGTWTWRQDLYGRQGHHLGAGHGLAGNAFPALRGAAFLAPALRDALVARSLETLQATALRATVETPDGPVEWLNWHPMTDRERVAAWQARGGRPLVQDCHGAPGIVVRLAGAPRTADWDALLRGAGETTWAAGPLAKGPSVCHGTAGSALACLKLWRRLGEPRWLERGRRLAQHAAGQVERARAGHGQGRHSLWTGDLGVACVLWNAVRAAARFPTLDAC